MDKKMKTVIIAGVAIVLGVAGWWFLGNYRESKIIAQEKVSKLLEANK